MKERYKGHRRKYQTGIQDFVYEVIKSIEYIPNKDFITFSEIVDEVRKYRPELNNPVLQVKQAIYQLSRNRKLRRKRIEKVETPDGSGWRAI